MTPQSPPPLNITAALTFFAGLLFDSRVAAYVGPYSAIILGAVLGAAFSASGRGEASRPLTVGYMALMIALAMVATVPLAEVVAARIPMAKVEPQAIFGVMAALIAYIGYGWIALGRWVVNLARAPVERAIRSIFGPPPGGPQ